MLALWLISVVASVIFDPSGEADGVDAVVVLAGGRGERIDTALALVDEGAAVNLVISAGDRAWDGWDAIEPLCAGDIGVRVWCVDPSPDSTRGEAATIAAFAEDRGWDRLALVTSDYHLRRAALHFDRCFAGDVEPIAAPSGLTSGRLSHEVGALLAASTFDRSCG